MAEDTGELRSEIDDRRRAIADTVDQIENRVSPARIASRRTNRVRQRFTDLADTVMGNDEPDYSTNYRAARVGDYGARTSDNGSDDEGGLLDRARGGVGNVGDAPEQLRRQARGNPAAAGMISFGIGLLLGSVLPESRKEKQMIAEAQPQLNAAAAQAASAGQDVADELKEPLKEAAESLKDTASAAGDEVKAEAKSAAEATKQQASN